MDNINLQALTKTQLEDLAASIEQELLNRKTVPLEQQLELEVMQHLQDTGVIPPQESGLPWSDPDSDMAKMYRPGVEVVHNGGVYRSVYPALNPHEPGTDNGQAWKFLRPAEEAEDGIPEFFEGEDLLVGDVRRYEGKKYRVAQAHRTQWNWNPERMPSFWEPVED